MAEAVRDWVRSALLAMLLVGAAAAGAQTAPGNEALGTLTGKLTDLHSTPLDGATVVVRNEATGAETRGITQRNGSFRFTGLQAGVYVVEAESPQLGRGQLKGVVVPAGHEARVQAAMMFEQVVARPVLTAVEKTAPFSKAVIAAATPGVAAIHLPKDEPLRIASEAAPVVPVHPVVAVENVPEVDLLVEVKDPLVELKLIERRAAEAARNMPAADAQVLVADVASKPLLTLNLPASRNVEATAPAAGSAIQFNGLTALGSIAMREAAAVSAVRAAIGSVHLLPRAVHPPHDHADSGTASTATTLTGAEIRSLPAAGRRWQDFVLDTPTAATAAGGTQAAGFRGASQQPAETTIDGANTRMAFGGAGNSGTGSSGPGSDEVGGRNQNGMGQAWAGGHGSQVAEAAIREVQTEAGNAEIEGSRTAGSRVNVETARGSNGLHGQGFAFDRQNTWGAQNPFTQWVTETAPAVLTYNPSGPPLSVPVFDNGLNGPPESYTPPDHESVWGIGAGSQIRRDKLFWFAALDSYNRNDPGLSMVKHPYLLQTLTGCEFAPCTQITGFFGNPTYPEMQALCARLDLIAPGQTGQQFPCTNPIVQGFEAYSPILESLAGLLGPAPRTAKQLVGFTRLDWQAAERHRFTLEGIGADWNSPGGGLTGLSENYGNHSFGSSNASEELLLGRWEAFLTPNLLAVTQGSMGRNILSAHAGTPSAFEQTFLAPNAYGQLPEIVVDNRYGFTIGNPSRFGPGSYPDERVSQMQESLDWVRGTLLVKSGFQLSHDADATSLLRNQTGTYTYSNVENFASDALVFAKFGLQNPNDVLTQHGCDATGKAWTSAIGQPMGLGNLPCYSYYSQVIGPTNWNLSTNDWAGFTTVQWHPRKLLVMSAGLRWEREQLPLPIALLNNPELPLTEKLPSLGNDWAPRISLALGNAESRWPVLRLGYGMYFGRTENATVETALTQTGSPNGDLSFFMRPTDDCQNCVDGAPPFPYVLRGPPGSVVKPGAVEFAPNFRNPEIHQAVAAVEEELPGHVQVTASALLSLGRRLPISIDANLGVPTQNITYNVCDQIPTAPNNGQCGNSGLGPIKATQITVPFYASLPSSNCPSGSLLYLAGQSGWCNPNYQQVEEFTSKANSTYEAAVLRVVRYGRRGLSLHAHYTYAHAMDWNPNESPLNPLSPANLSQGAQLDGFEFSQEHGTSDLDMRHSAAAMLIYEAPWKLHNLAGQFANGWMISGIGQFRSGLPYTMRTSGSLAEEFDGATAIVGLGPGMNGSGGDNRVYGMGSDGRSYNIGRNTFRYSATWKADMRVGKKFDMGRMRELELLLESFNLFNHQNVTGLETTGYYIESGTPASTSGGPGGRPTLNFLTGLKANTTAFGQPLNVNATNFYRERQIQVGVRMRF
jgi:hypothetical protein